mmetsp:Transcript_5331/g.20008  ORF Transcript_5331/g.20008 Transcript_5331/m.20008 type:complete len:409 (-) Transcript_5331:227-1453(-)
MYRESEGHVTGESKTNTHHVANPGVSPAVACCAARSSAAASPDSSSRFRASPKVSSKGQYLYSRSYEKDFAVSSTGEASPVASAVAPAPPVVAPAVPPLVTTPTSVTLNPRNSLSASTTVSRSKAPTAGTSPKNSAVAIAVWCPTVTWNFILLPTFCLWNRIFSATQIAALKVGTVRGADTKPLSIRLWSNCATHIPSRSPRSQNCTGRLNICMLFIFFSSFKVGSSTESPTAIRPLNTVPVSTVPWPLIGKQWSTAKRNSSFPFFFANRRQCAASTRFISSFTKLVTPVAGAPPADISTAPPGRAAIGTMTHSLNFVALNVFPRRAVILAIFSPRPASGIMSVLFSTTSNSLVVISPTTKHSAVCVWMPLFTSTTSIITSMICAPPNTVLIKLACPGQSTSVNWISS